MMKLDSEMGKCAISVIIFSSIALEAYIYDYAARHLSDQFVQNLLDKLDPVSKWVIVPRLITGKELSRQRRWFDRLKRLIKTRNSIIHNKSFDTPQNPVDAATFIKKIESLNDQIFQQAREAIQLLEEIGNEIQKVDPEEAFLTNIYLSKRLEEA